MKLFIRGWRTGEPLVWLTSMGLAAGLMMVVVLLIVIFWNGIQAFWPRQVAQIQLAEDSRFKINDQSRLAGEVTKIREKKVPHRIGEKHHEEPVEWQLFVANRDKYGFSFYYLDEKDIQDTSYPEDIIVLERLEYGDAIGFPEEIRDGLSGQVVAATHAGFKQHLAQSIAKVRERWQVIEDLEKHQIGAINRRFETLRLKLKRYEADEDTTAVQATEEKIKELRNEYQILASEAAELRDQQEVDTFQYRLATGQQVTVPIGNVLGFYFPNQLGLFGRIKLFFKNIWHFLYENPREANTEGGIFPAIYGTFVMTLIMSIAVMPFGVLAAIYLREYAKQGLLVRIVRIAVNNLAGVPSIVFGVFGLGFFVYMTGGTLDALFFPDRLPTPTFGTGGVLWASLTLALMTLPVVIVSTEEGLAAVPRGAREASLALGASKWQTIQRVVLPASSPGMLTGLILAMARGAGEVAPLMLVGVVKLAPSLPVDGIYPFLHLERKFMHLGFHIFDLGFQSPDSEAARPMVFATTFLLIGLVVVLNLAAILVREKLRKKYSQKAF